MSTTTMSTTTLSTSTMSSFRGYRVSAWDRVKLRVAEWQRRSRSRHELQFLSDTTLRDIGVTRCDVHRELSKPFWMP